jgi:hypothetical protein
MPSEFPLIFGGISGYLPAMWFEQFSHGIAYDLSRFGFKLANQGEACSALNEADNGLAAILANNCIGFPVAKAAKRLNGGRVLLNRLSVGDDLR